VVSTVVSDDGLVVSSGFMVPPTGSLYQESNAAEISRAASKAEEMLLLGQLPKADEAKRSALFGWARKESDGHLMRSTQVAHCRDTLYSIRVSFTGLSISLVDSAPSEICTITMNGLNALAKWNLLRRSDASLLISIGFLQVDNHIPSAPFPVALCPDGRDYQGGKSSTDDGDVLAPGTLPTSEGGSTKAAPPPLLFVAIEFAPKHSSGIVVSA